MSAVGLVINAGWDESSPPTREYTDLGFGSGSIHRTIIQGPLEPILDRAWATLPANAKLYVTLNRECSDVGWDYAGLEATCEKIARRYKDLVWGIGFDNEADLLFDWFHDPVWTPEACADRVRRGAPIFEGTGIYVGPTSLASGTWQDYLARLTPLVREWVDFVDLHLYMKDAGGVMPGWQSIQDALEEAHRISQLPVISSEGGIKEDDAGGKEQQALWAANFFTIAQALPADRFPYLALFSWHDRIGTATEQGGQSFGLRSFTGDKEPSWYTAQRALGGPQPVTAARPTPTPLGGGIGPGFRAWALLEPHVVGEIIETNEFGAVQGLSQVKTSLGIMTWANLVDSGPTLTFIGDTPPYVRRYWREEWPQSKVKVIA